MQLPYGDADQLLQVALRHGVDFMPGSAHTVTDDDCRDWLRIAYARPPEMLCEGIARLAAAWAEYTRTTSLRSTLYV